MFALTYYDTQLLSIYSLFLQICFFRQFGHSVVRSDYLTLRKGFIMVRATLMSLKFFTFRYTLFLLYMLTMYMFDVVKMMKLITLENRFFCSKSFK